MAITTKLELRQSQSLVMTPQLQQAIKLLQLSNLELASFVDAELERNPLLEKAESGEDGRARPRASLPRAPSMTMPQGDRARPRRGLAGAAAGEEGGRERGARQTRARRARRRPIDDLDAEPQDVFPEQDAFTPGALKDSGWATLGSGQRAGGDDAPEPEAYVAEERTLRDHLTEQLSLAFTDPAQRLIGQHLIDMTDEAGYLQGDLAALAELLGAPIDLVLADALRSCRASSRAASLPATCANA